MKKGLIMEGGAMRGIFTAGVIDVLMEAGIEFDGAIGVSAGAAFGCNYKSHQIGRVLSYNLRFCKDPRFAGVRSLLKTGDLYGAEFCYKTIPYELDPFDKERYDSDPMEFYVVCTDVDTGRAVYHRCDVLDDEALDWIRASASMPMVSQVVRIGRQRLLDGGIADSIPIRYFESIGYDRNVLILTRPEDYVKGPNKLLPFFRITLRQMPRILKAIRNRHVVYNETTAYIRQQERAGQVFVIRPPEELEISRVEHDPERILAVYRIGVETARAALPALRAFLEQEGKAE